MKNIKEENKTTVQKESTKKLASYTKKEPRPKKPCLKDGYKLDTLEL